MNEYISSFTTGFGEVVAKALPMSLKSVKIISIYDGLIHYRYDGNSEDINKIIYFNNTFYVMRKYCGKELSFSTMISKINNSKLSFLYKTGTFRVRYSRENQFVKVDKYIAAVAEKNICKQTRMNIDRVNPQNEFWFIIRRENIGFLGQLLRKRKYTEKVLEKGELRPEFAFLMGIYADIRKNEVICDPFAGHGAIPIQMSKSFGVKNILVSDIDRNCVNKLKDNVYLKKSGVRIMHEDALVLKSVPNNLVDVIITDPPWGYYEEIEDITSFYTKMFSSFRRILKATGRAIVLSARKNELIKATEIENVIILDQLNTLVNGKKASLFYLKL